MHQQPNSGQLNAASLAAQQSSVPHPVPVETHAHQSQPSGSHWSLAKKIGFIAATGTGAAGASNLLTVATSNKEANRTAERATKAGLREVYKNCREKSPNEYSNKDALYDINTYDGSQEAGIDCLKCSDRLEQNTHYTVEHHEAVPFAKNGSGHQVSVLNKQKEPAAIKKMNAAQKEFNRIDHQADEILENLNTDQVASMRGTTAELKDNIATAARTTEETAVTVANPQSSAKAVMIAKIKAKAAEKKVEFSVTERDSHLGLLETETQINQTTVAESATPTTKPFPGSAPFASMGNPCFHKKQEQFCSVSEPIPTLTGPSNQNPDFKVAFILFGLSAFFTVFFFFARQKRLDFENNLKGRAERHQNLYEIEWEERKELSNIALVLKESHFLNILHKYKMQTVNLTEAKDLLSTKCGLSESDILLILKIV